MGYNACMFEVRKTETYLKWINGLRDIRGRAQSRVERLAAGHPEDARSVGERVSELRIDHGPGYRVYFTKREGATFILLAGGDKDSQVRDIKVAQELARDL